MKHVVLDFETTSVVDIKSAGAWRYAEDPTTEVLCLCYETRNPNNICLWTPEHSSDGYLRELALDPEIIFVAHNAGFEKAVWRRIMVPEYGFPDVPNSRWHDTLAVCAMKVLPLDLDGACQTLGLPAKDKEGHKLIRDWAKFKKDGSYLIPRTPENYERVYAYCRRDVEIERALHDRLGGFQPGERLVWQLDQRINERGVRIDLRYVAACEKIVREATAPLAKEFKQITGGLKFTQTKAIRDWCDKEGYFLPDLRKERLTDVLGVDFDADGGDGSGEGGDNGNHADLPEHVRRALTIRQLVGSASVKKLPRMRSCVGANGRARGLLQYHGAGPGRWSGRLLQPQNFPRPTIKLGGKPAPLELIVNAILTGDYQYVDLVVGAPIETIISGLRHAIIPNPDRVFVSGDYSQVEARIVLALAGQLDKLKIFLTGTPYADMAEAIYGRPIDKYNDLAEYTIGKNTVLGCGFQMGWRTFQSRYCPHQPDEFAQKVIQTYRKEWAPEVPKVWWGLEAAALYTVYDGTPHEAYGVTYALEDEWLTARLPSGRKLYYYRPTKCTKAMPWDPDDVRASWRYLAEKMGQPTWVDAFGGLLTENVVQALARDLLVSAMFRSEKEGMPIVLTVHDEIVIEPLTKNADEVAFAQIMRERPAWAEELKLPVNVETWIGDRYRK